MCCHRIINPKFNDVCVLFKHSNFCSRMLEMHSMHPNFSRNSYLQVTPLPQVCFLLHLLQSFCHLLKILSKTLYCVAMKQQIRGEKTKPQKGKPKILVCGFEACLHILIFIVNGHFTISIPEISQVVMVFCILQ